MVRLLNSSFFVASLVACAVSTTEAYAGWGDATGGTGYGSREWGLSLGLNSVQIHSPFSLKTDDNRTVTVDGGSNSLVDLHFERVSGSWVVVKLKAADGSIATLHTGKKSASGLVEYGNTVVNPSITKQEAGLRFATQDTGVEYGSTWTRTRSCTATVNKIVCHVDPVTHRDVCNSVPVNVPGNQSYESYEVKTNVSHTVEILSDDLQDVKGTLTFRSVIREDHESNVGTCIPDPYN